MSIWNSIAAFFGRKAKTKAEAPAKAKATPVTAPAVASQPRYKDTLPFQYAYWNESGPTKAYGGPAPAYSHRTTKVPGALNYLQIHPLYAPIFGKAFSQSAAFVAAQIDKAKREGWQGVVVDAENQFWSMEALKWIYEKAKQKGVMCYLCPKATLDPGGKTLHPDFKRVTQFLDAFSDGLWLWAYGSHLNHIAAREKLLKNGYNKEIALVHDAFRNDTKKGYIGLSEGPKLAKWCKANRVPFVLFQPHKHTTAQLKGTW